MQDLTPYAADCWLNAPSNSNSGLLRHGDTSSELHAISRFKAMEGLNPQVKRKILSDNPRRFYVI